MEVLAFNVGDDFEVLDEVVRLVLRVELGLVEVPGLREVVQFTQGRGAVLLQLLGEEVDGVDGFRIFSAPDIVLADRVEFRSPYTQTCSSSSKTMLDLVRVGMVIVGTSPSANWS